MPFFFIPKSKNQEKIRKNNRYLSLISTLYIFIFYYKIILNFLLFQPLFINVIDSTPENAAVYFFPNQIGGFIWKQSNIIHTKTLFYINSFNGNCSTRFNIIQRLHSYLPSSYQIIHLDLPGFGLSNYLKTDYNSILQHITEAINLFLLNNENHQYSIFTEFESSVLISQIYPSLSYPPSHIIHFNPKISLFDHLCNKYSFYSSPLFIPFLFYPNLNDLYDRNVVVDDESHKTSFAIMENFSSSIGDDIFINLPVHFTKKRLLKLDGEGIASLICNTNQNILKTFNSFFRE